jgi:hypothetical protein
MQLGSSLQGHESEGGWWSGERRGGRLSSELEGNHHL